MYNRQGSFLKALDLVPHIEKELESYEDKINKEKHLLFNYNLAYTFFGAGDFRKALKYINDVLNDNEKQLRQDIYSFSRIFNLIIHFELNNHDFIEYDIKSAARFLNKFEKDYEVENLFVSEMKIWQRQIHPLSAVKFLSGLTVSFQNF
ncbi:MAG: hypothetical protein IPM77_06355 [Crocinitomicaceae bacterium]|nr:hypothetical protein [Crocinitomicaceae bacterium]